MNLEGLLHSESRVVLGLSRKQSIEENSGDANNDKHSLHWLPLGKGKHIKSYFAIVISNGKEEKKSLLWKKKRKKLTSCRDLQANLLWEKEKT